MPDPVYLDCAATTPLRPEAREAMLDVLARRWGNPSSVHRWGREARAALEDARARFAGVIGAAPAEIVFTRGGTEADNLAVLGRARGEAGPIVCSAIEHKAVLSASKVAAGDDDRLRIIPVDHHGVLDLDAVAEVVRDGRPSLVSVIW